MRPHRSKKRIKRSASAFKTAVPSSALKNILNLKRKNQELSRRLVHFQREIEDLRKKEASLEQVECQSRDLMSNLPGMAYRCRNERDWPMFFVSVGCMDLTGYSPMDFTSRRIVYNELIHPQDRKRIWKEVQNALRQKRHFEFRYRIRTKRGEEKWVLEHGHGVNDRSGRLLYLDGLIIDISGFARAEEELRESEERYRSLIEMTRTAYVILDSKGKVLDANDEYVRLTGHKGLDQVLGRSVIQWTLPREKENNAKAIRECLKKGFLRDFETAYVDRHGRVTPILIIATVIEVKGNKKIFSLCHSVAEIKRAEEGIRRSLSLERATLESTADGILVVEDNGAKVSDFNDRFAQLWNIPDAILRSRDDEKLLKYVLPQLNDPGSFLSKVTDLYRHPRKESFDVLKLKNGKILERYSRPQILDGKPVGRVWSFRDVTERELIEKELRESEEKFRSVTEQSPNMIFINQGGRVVYANQQCAKAMGYSIKEFYAPHFNFLSLIHPDDFGMVRRNFRLHQRGKEVAPSEYKMLTKERKVLNTILATKLIDYRGQKAILGIITDITARKKSDELLSQREAYLTSIIENQPGMVWLKDKESRLLAVNHTYVKMAGKKSVEEVVGKTDLDFWPSEMANQFRADDRRVMKSKKHITVEELISEKGAARWHETFKAPVFGANGQVIGTSGYARDITARKKSEHDLRASEMRYRRLFEAAKDGILILNGATGMIEDVNPFLVRMLGYSYEAFLGKKLWEVGAFQDKKKCRAAFRELQTKKYIRYDDLPLEAKDGRLIQVEFVSNVYLIDGVKVIQCNIRDVTERRKAEKLLEESRKRLRHVVDSVPGVVYEFSLHPDGKMGLSFISAGVKKMLGISAETLHRDFSVLIKMIHPEDLQSFRASILDTAKTFGPWSHEFRVRTPAGLTAWFFGNSVPVPMEEDKIRRWRGTVIDITKLKQAEAELKEGRRQLRQIIDTVPHMIFAKDETGRFLLVNRAVGMMYGMEPRLLMGKKRQDIHPVREEAERSLKEDRKVLETGKPVIVKDEIFTDGKGGKHVLQTIRIPFEMAGLKERAILGVSVDVTEQKKVEEFRNDIVRTVSHELRTPLSIEKEGISLLLDGVLGAINSEQKEVLETVMRSIDRLSRMITNLLDISSIETGKIKLLQERTELVNLVKDVAFEFKKRASEKNIDLNKKLPGHEVWILADPDKITQALSNLVDNAIKFTPEGGAVEISLSVSKDGAECCIRDTGVGIAPENISKMFEKFQQFSRTAGPGEKGFGLGLSITKGIIEMHKGRIWAESELGKGTQIIFTLPLHSRKGG